MYSYLYFTTKEAALRIAERGYLRPSRTDGNVYAVDVAGCCVPSVQHPKGVSPEVAVLFETPEAPNWVNPEEVVWTGSGPLAVYNATIISLGAAQAMLGAE